MRVRPGGRQVRSPSIFSSPQFPDLRYATISDHPRPHCLSGALTMIDNPAWVEGEFIHFIQTRGASVIEARGASSAASAAEAIVQHTRDWVLGSSGHIVSMGVYTDGSAYGVSAGLVFSLPVITRRGGGYDVEAGLSLNDFAARMVKASETELLLEQRLAGGEHG